MYNNLYLPLSHGNRFRSRPFAACASPRPIYHVGNINILPQPGSIENAVNNLPEVLMKGRPNRSSSPPGLPLDRIWASGEPSSSTFWRLPAESTAGISDRHFPTPAELQHLFSFLRPALPTRPPPPKNKWRELFPLVCSPSLFPAYPATFPWPSG